MEVKLAIVGSRTFNDYATFNFVMNKICRENDYDVKQVISGGAVGADTYGEQFARLRNIPIRVLRPDWNREGKKAGFLRNVEIIKACLVCVAFGMGKVMVLVMIYCSVSSRRKTAGYIILRQISYSFELVPKRVMTSLGYQQRHENLFNGSAI